MAASVFVTQRGGIKPSGSQVPMGVGWGQGEGASRGRLPKLQGVDRGGVLAAREGGESQVRLGPRRGPQRASFQSKGEAGRGLSPPHPPHPSAIAGRRRGPHRPAGRWGRGPGGAGPALTSSGRGWGRAPTRPHGPGAAGSSLGPRAARPAGRSAEGRGPVSPHGPRRHERAPLPPPASR